MGSWERKGVREGDGERGREGAGRRREGERERGRLCLMWDEC